MTKDTNKEKKAVSLLYDILAEAQCIESLLNLKNNMIEPCWYFSDDDKFAEFEKKYEEVQNSFEELVDLMLNYEDKDMDAFYDLMGWTKPDKEKTKKFVEGIVNAVVEATIIARTLGVDEDDDRDP